MKLTWHLPESGRKTLLRRIHVTVVVVAVDVGGAVVVVDDVDDVVEPRGLDLRKDQVASFEAIIHH